MRGAAWIPVAVGGLATGALFWAEATRRPRVAAAAKVTASAGFVTLALVLGAATPYARIVLAALLLSAAGDALLLGRAPRVFLAGMVAFLLAHVAYAVAFARDASPMAWTAAGLVAALALVVRWLWPHLGPMRGAVLAYCVAISAMAWFALSHPSVAVRVGAVLFYVSDLTVARDRFVKEETANLLVGHPLYFIAQYLIASSVG